MVWVPLSRFVKYQQKAEWSRLDPAPSSSSPHGIGIPPGIGAGTQDAGVGIHGDHRHRTHLYDPAFGDVDVVATLSEIFGNSLV